MAEMLPAGTAAANAAVVAAEGAPLPLAVGQPVPEQARARTASAAALGDMQAAILYAEAEHIMEFLQVRPPPCLHNIAFEKAVPCSQNLDSPV